MRRHTRRTACLFALVASVLAAACWRIEPAPPAPPPANASKADEPAAQAARGDRNVALGLPSAADTSSEDDYLLAKPEFTLSYNRSRGGPNWVSWSVRRADLGSVERSNEFHPEPDLPAAWRITPNDYTGSGYDRGHVCPSGDRTRSKAANEATFSMANMLPQAGALNRVSWEGLESFCRSLVKAGNDIYIVAGGYGDKGTIAKGRVSVPARCWKVVLVVPAGADVPGSVTPESRIIAADFPNDESVDPDWKKYATTVAAIEQATGLTLFASCAPSTREALRVKPSALNADEGADERPRGESSNQPVIGNRNSKVYHVPGCPDYRDVAKENRVKFASAEEAERAGYRRAGNCP